MKKIGLIFYTFYCWILVFTGFILHFTFATSVMFFFKDPGAINLRITGFFIKFFMRLANIRIISNGIENIPKNSNFIIMSNHASLLDVLIYIAVIPYKFAFIAKKQLSKVPLLGWNIRLQDHFLIDRVNPRSAVKTLDQVKRRLENKTSALFFPEGTRSKDGSLLPFKRGGFTLAVDTNTCIVPAYIRGTGEIIKKNSLLINPGKIEVKFAKPILIQTTSANKKQSKDLVFDLMDKTFDQIQTLIKSSKNEKYA